MYRIALVSREVSPSAGRGAYVLSTASALAGDAEVTLITSEAHAELTPEGLRTVFVPEPAPEEAVSYFNVPHVWSARAYEALKEAFPDGGPDVVEFADTGAEGTVTVQAKQTLDPALRNTTVAVRAYGSQEIRDVLNGHLPVPPGARTLYDLERYALKYADRLLWPGGDVLETYRRFYGELAPAALVRQALDGEEAVEPAPPAEGRFRFVYPAALERRNGVLALMRAVTGLERDDWSLTLAGEDTRTAPLGVSMREQLELMAADDPRIVFASPDEAELARHDAAIVPALWTCWPLSVLRALSSNRPVLGTAVGGLTELVTATSGWLAGGTDADAIAVAVERVLDGREAAAELVAAEGPRKEFERFTATETVREAYADLAKAAGGARKRRGRAQAPVVSAVVPYYRLERYVGETIASLYDQTYAPLEVIVVNDGSFREEDRVLEELAATYPIVLLVQENSGLGAARNFGIRQSGGRYVFPLDADNVADPGFVERCVDVLEANDDVAYVTSWSRFLYEEGIPRPEWAVGYHPLSNDALAVDSINTAGDAAAVVRRSVFDSGFRYSVDAGSSYEDWLFYRMLERAGLHGHVIPERLLVYRVRQASMHRQVGQPHSERLLGEMDAYLRAREVEWTPTSA